MEATQIDKLNDFYDWFYNRIQSIHVIDDVQFENINDKL